MDCVPERVLLIGCQPGDVDSLGEGLTPAVERAVGVAVARIGDTLRDWRS